MDRRVFLQWVGLGWLASLVPGCFSQTSGGSGPAATAPAASAPVASAAPVSVGPVSALDQAGFLLNKETSLGPVLVTGDGSDPNSLKAVNPTCTHKGCIVDWKSDQKAFECPCHGARFATDGSVLQGPADRPLTTYQARVENGAVLVSQGNG
ncbi:MAG TPA: Rieske 2Fe-2S domain-containing protein [Leptolyngbyaceae cyanobacterium]